MGSTVTRVTVEDYLDNVGNHFELVMLVIKRACQLATGGKEPKVAWENNKPTAVVLREITSDPVGENVVQQEDIVENEPLFAAFDDEADAEAL